jgi:hypothetical protein
MRKLSLHLPVARRLLILKKTRYLNKRGILIVIMIQASCANLYKINTTTELSIIDSSLLNDVDKQLIIHLKDTAFALMSGVIRGNELEAKLFPLTDIQRKYSYPRSESKNVYEKRDESTVLNEVHLYASNTNFSDTARFSIPISSISKINTYQKNVEATKRSKVVGGIVVSVVAIGALALLASAVTANMF